MSNRSRSSNNQRRNVQVDEQSAQMLWFSLLNRWDSNTFERARSLQRDPPRTPAGYTLFAVCPLETARNLLDNGYELSTRSNNKGDFYWTVGLGNIEKAALFLQRRLVSDNELVHTANTFQTLDLLKLYRRHLSQEMWRQVQISESIIKSIIASPSFVSSILQQTNISKDVLEALFIATKPSQSHLALLTTVPESWAERVPLNEGVYPNLLTEVVRRKLPLEIINILLTRGLVPLPEDTVRILSSYDPSIRRDKVYYTALMRMKMSEPDLLNRYMHIDSTGRAATRYRIVRSLFFTQGICDADKKYRHEGCTNDSTLLGDLNDIPDPYIYKYTSSTGITYCFNLMEIATDLFAARNANTSYQNPYTRESIPFNDVVRMTNIIVDLGKRGYPLYPLDTSEACGIPIISVPSPVERINRIVSLLQLDYYVDVINDMIREYGTDTVIASKTLPNIIRYYDEDLIDAIFRAVPSFKNIVMSSI